MMTSLQKPIQMQVAVMRMAGYTFSANLRILQDLTSLAIIGPFIPYRAFQSSTSGAVKAPTEVSISVGKTTASKPEGSTKQKNTAIRKVVPIAKSVAASKAKVEPEVPANPMSELERKVPVKPKAVAKSIAVKEPNAPTKSVVAAAPEAADEVPENAKRKAGVKPDMNGTAKPKAGASPKAALKPAVDTKPTPVAASQANPAPARTVSTSRSADTAKTPKKARAPSSPPTMLEKPSHSKT